MKKSLKAHAQAIDTKKDKIVLAGLALFASFMAIAFFSTSARANIPPDDALRANNTQADPFEYKSQKFSH